MSKINIKNIAICMYGQYRTGDACLEYIKRFYECDNVNIDFFCSLKPYETTYTRQVYNDKNNRELLDQDQLTDKQVSYQHEQINKYFNPKKFKVYSKEYEDELKDIQRSIIHSKVLAGWTDSVMLKQQYEVENDITYDLVIMQRYDVIVWPNVAFKMLLDKVQGMNTDERGTIVSADKNFIFCQPIEITRKYDGTFMYPNAQDLWVWGFGTAMDTLVYDALEYIPSKYKSNYSDRKFHNGYPFVDTHEMIGSICRKMTIPYSMFPSVSPAGHVCLPQEYRQQGIRYTQVAPIPIRTSYFEDGIIPDLATLSNKEIEDLYDNVMLKKWDEGC